MLMKQIPLMTLILNISAKRYSNEIQSELDKLSSQNKAELFDEFAMSLDSFVVNQINVHITSIDEIADSKDDLTELLTIAKRYATVSETKEKIDKDLKFLNDEIKTMIDMNKKYSEVEEDKEDKNIFGKIKKKFLNHDYIYLMTIESLVRFNQDLFIDITIPIIRIVRITHMIADDMIILLKSGCIPINDCNKYKI